jgi:hypothetical protein
VFKNKDQDGGDNKNDRGSDCQRQPVALLRLGGANQLEIRRSAHVRILHPIPKGMRLPKTFLFVGLVVMRIRPIGMGVSQSWRGFHSASEKTVAEHFSASK